MRILIRAPEVYRGLLGNIPVAILVANILASDFGLADEFLGNGWFGIHDVSFKLVLHLIAQRICAVIFQFVYGILLESEVGVFAVEYCPVRPVAPVAVLIESESGAVGYRHVINRMRLAICAPE